MIPQGLRQETMLKRDIRVSLSVDFVWNQLCGGPVSQTKLKILRSTPPVEPMIVSKLPDYDHCYANILFFLNLAVM